MSGDDRDRRSWRRLAWRVRAGVLAVLAGAGAGAWLWAPPYLREALHDSRLILAGAVALSCLLLLALLGRAMLLAAAHARKAHRTGQEGQAILEFALVMPILLMIVLVMIQVSLLMGGLVNLHYSAYCAARAGVVAVPLQTNSEAQNQMGDFQADAWVPNSDEKIQRVFTAAVWALIPYSCGSKDVAEAPDGAALEGQLSQVFGDYGAAVPSWVNDYLGRKLAYARDHTRVRVQVPQPVGSEAFRPGEDIHVTVTHDLFLGVPYANAIFSAINGGKSLGAGNYAVEIAVESRLSNEGVQDFIDIEEFPHPN